MQLVSVILLFSLVFTCKLINGAAPYVIESFPSLNSVSDGNWTSGAMAISSSLSFAGPYSAVWKDTTKYKTVERTNLPLQDWSNYSRLNFYAYSANKTNAEVVISITSENTASSGWDYYASVISINWEGEWKKISLPFSSMAVERSPIGWNSINKFGFHSGFDSYISSPYTVLYLDQFELIKDTLVPDLDEVDIYMPNVAEFPMKIPLRITNSDTRDYSYTATIVKGDGAPSYIQVSLSKTSGSIAVSSKQETEVQFQLTSAAQYDTKQTWKIYVQFHESSTNELLSTVTYKVAIKGLTTPIKEHPYLYCSSSDVSRINSISDPIGKQAISAIISAADLALTQNLTVPREGGGWNLQFVCGSSGTKMTFDINSPLSYYCPATGEYVDGTKDEVVRLAWVMKMHDYLLQVMQNLSFAFFVKPEKTEYAKKLSQILMDYATTYPSLKYQAREGKNLKTGGKLSQQTLDEADEAMRMALCYDLVYPYLSDAQRIIIEWNLLRQMVPTIQRNTGVEGNWQIFHNSAYITIGLVVNDRDTVEYGLNNPGTGAIWQLENLVLDDGFWWETSMFYQTFSLDAFLYITEAVSRNTGTNVYTMKFTSKTPGLEKTFENMFTSIVRTTLPNLLLPPVNDGKEVYLSDMGSVFEIAKARYPNNRMFDYILANITRGNSMLGIFAGYKTPIDYSAKNPFEQSDYLPNTGLVALRSDNGKNTLVMDYGPYGSGHGHNDKMNIILYAQERLLLQDSASNSYTANAYQDYFKASASHNTLMINGHKQLEVDGSLEFFNNKMVSAVSNEIYDNVSVRRVLTILPTNQYSFLDVSFAYEVSPKTSLNYTVDYILHSFGTLIGNHGFLANGTNAKQLSNSVAQKLLGSESSKEWTYITDLTQFIPYSDDRSKSFSYSWTKDVRFYSLLDSVEDFTSFRNLVQTTYEGRLVGKWSDMTSKSSITWYCPTDWSEFDSFSFTVISDVSNNFVYTVALFSENDATSGADFYYGTFTIDFTGTKTFIIYKKDLKAIGTPVGFQKIDYVKISANLPRAGSVLFLKDFKILDINTQVLPTKVGPGMSVVGNSDEGLIDFFIGSAPEPEGRASNKVTIERRQMNGLLNLQNLKPFVHVINPYEGGVYSATVQDISSKIDCISDTDVTFSEHQSMILSSKPRAEDCGLLRLVVQIQTTNENVTVHQMYQSKTPYAFTGSFVQHANNLFAAYGVKRTVCQQLDSTDTTACFTPLNGSSLSADVKKILINSEITTSMQVQATLSMIMEADTTNLLVTINYPLSGDQWVVSRVEPSSTSAKIENGVLQITYTIDSNGTKGKTVTLNPSVSLQPRSALSSSRASQSSFPATESSDMTNKGSSSYLFHHIPLTILMTCVFVMFW